MDEWAGRHGASYDLELTGPAGGHWRAVEESVVTMDALEFCRALSGRAPAEGLLRTQVPSEYGPPAGYGARLWTKAARS